MSDTLESLRAELATATRRAEEAEAGAAGMRKALEMAAGRPLFSGPVSCVQCFTPIDGKHPDWCVIGHALVSTAGRALLDELEQARADREALGPLLKKLEQYRNSQQRRAALELITAFDALPAALRERLGKG